MTSDEKLDDIVTTAANVIDQTFRQRHTMRDIEVVIRAALRAAHALGREEQRKRCARLTEAARNDHGQRGNTVTEFALRELRKAIEEDER